MSSQTLTPDFRDNGHLDKKMSICRDKWLVIVVPTIETVVLNMLPCCQHDLCPPRFQVLTSGTGIILTQKMSIQREKCLAKVASTIETVVLMMLPCCQDDLWPLRLQLQTSGTMVILTEKMSIQREKCLAKVAPSIETVVLICCLAVSMIFFFQDSKS